MRVSKHMRERIEQAIARGWTASYISDRMGIDIEDVHAAWDRLDLINIEQPEERVPARCGTTSGWARHQASGERPCKPCIAARHRYDSTRRSATREDTAA